MMSNLIDLNIKMSVTFDAKSSARFLEYLELIRYEVGDDETVIVQLLAAGIIERQEDGNITLHSDMIITNMVDDSFVVRINDSKIIDFYKNNIMPGAYCGREPNNTNLE